MSKPLWLTFLPIDVRRAYSIERRLTREQQHDFFRLALKIALVAADSYCVVNPQSLIEDDMALQLTHEFLPAFDTGMIRLSSSEGDLAAHFSNKQAEYRDVADNYGLERVSHFLREVYPVAAVHWRHHSIGESINAQLTSEQFFESLGSFISPQFASSAFEFLPDMSERLRADGRSLTWRDLASVAPTPFVVGRSLELTTLRAYFEAHRLSSNHAVFSNMPFFEGLDHLLCASRGIDFRAVAAGLTRLGIISLLARASVGQVVSLVTPESQRLLLPGLMLSRSGVGLVQPPGIRDLMKVAALGRGGALNRPDAVRLQAGIGRACEDAGMWVSRSGGGDRDDMLAGLVPGAQFDATRLEIINIKEVVMGDKFENIGAGTTIVNRSEIGDAFTAVSQPHSQKASELIEALGVLVENSGDPKAVEAYGEIAAELAKEEPDHGRLRQLLASVRAALPDILTVTKILDSLKGFF